MGSGLYNWGWAIIIVTLIFNVAMLPTRFMMMKSSLKMMRIQPKVDALKAKYSNLKMNDPKRAEMNTEMMALYKQEGVNMYGSCLPMLVQIPLFLAYYRVLGNAIELRQAQWFWLHDLSMPDPHLHFADTGDSFHVSGAVHHALTGHGSGAAEDDGVHDAGDLRVYDAAFCLGTGAVLGHEQRGQPGPSDWHQPVALGQGNARHCRAKSRQEGGRRQGGTGQTVKQGSKNRGRGPVKALIPFLCPADCMSLFPDLRSLSYCSNV